MGQEVSIGQQTKDAINRLIPRPQKSVVVNRKMFLISLETQIILQTKARSFLMRKKLGPLLRDYKFKLSQPANPFPYEDFTDSLHSRIAPLVLSQEQTVTKLSLASEGYEYHSVVIMQDDIIYEGE